MLTEMKKDHVQIASGLIYLFISYFWSQMPMLVHWSGMDIKQVHISIIWQLGIWCKYEKYGNASRHLKGFKDKIQNWQVTLVTISKTKINKRRGVLCILFFFVDIFLWRKDRKGTAFIILGSKFNLVICIQIWKDWTEANKISYSLFNPESRSFSFIFVQY
jgi:hypothetical protein